MLFHTPQFLIFFLLLLPLFLIARRAGKAPWILLAASQIFYGWWDWRFLILLWITILFDYVIAMRIYASKSLTETRAYLGLSIAVSLSILGFFKYWNFIVGSLDGIGVPNAQAFKMADIVLPLGISFYTFQSMGYVSTFTDVGNCQSEIRSITPL